MVTQARVCEQTTAAVATLVKLESVNWKNSNVTGNWWPPPLLEEEGDRGRRGNAAAASGDGNMKNLSYAEDHPSAGDQVLGTRGRRRPRRDVVENHRGSRPLGVGHAAACGVKKERTTEINKPVSRGPPIHAPPPPPSSPQTHRAPRVVVRRRPQ